ncbi:hypothetical protein V8G54_008275 [Vigna mungo]|uniref:Uncharacterized protein n=1 Tax=Vigna mungo TaxID=3915 RepID=A0AAQ3P3Y0_VIGMU
MVHHTPVSTLDVHLGFLSFICRLLVASVHVSHLPVESIPFAVLVHLQFDHVWCCLVGCICMKVENIVAPESDGSSSKDSAGKKKSNGQDNEENKIKHKRKKDMSNDDNAGQSHETSSLGKSPELSSRRIRVMENLGLIAPAGSPFQKGAHKDNQAS